MLFGRNAGKPHPRNDLCTPGRSTANSAKWPRTHFHGGNTGSNPVGDANKTEGVENRSKIVNRKALTCFKDLALLPTVSVPRGTVHSKVHDYDEVHLRAMPVRT